MSRMKMLSTHKILTAIIFGAGWILSLPWALTAPMPGLDSSWVLALSWAMTRNLQFGRDIVFTYGPLGFLEYPMLVDYGLWRISFLFGLLTHTLLIVSYYLAVREVVLTKGRRAKTLSYLCMITVLVLGTYWGFWLVPGQAIVISMILLFFVYSISKRQFSARMRVMFLVSSSFLLAVTSLIKYSYAVDSIFLLMALGVVLGFRSMGQFRSWSIAPVAYVLSTVLLWIIAGQGLPELGAFVLGGVQLTAGYSSAMGVEDISILETLFSFGSIAILLPIFLYYYVRRSPGILNLIVLNCLLLFSSFKHAFVRHDFGHSFFYFVLAEPFLFILSVMTLGSIDRFRRILHIVPLLAPLTLLVMIIFFPSPAILKLTMAHSMRPDRPDSLTMKALNYEQAITLFVSPQLGDSTVNSIKEQIRDEYSFKYHFFNSSQSQVIGNNSVDIFPWDITLLWAYDMDWSPRPVFQSYTAYTPWLDQINAAHFSSANAPEYILFAYGGAIDGRYPLYDEPATFRTILCRYEYVTSSDVYAILRLNQTRDCGDMIELGYATGKMGEVISIPRTDGFLFAKVHIKYGLLGALANILYKPAEIHMIFKFDDGKTSPPYRFIPANAEDGIYLSTYIGDFNGLQNLFQGKATPRINSIIFTSDVPAQYESSIEITYFTITHNAPSVTNQNILSTARGTGTYNEMSLSYVMVQSNSLGMNQNHSRRLPY